MTSSPQRHKSSVNYLSCIFCISPLSDAVIKFLDQSNLMEKGLILAHSSMIQSIMVGKVIVTELLRLAGHIVSMVKSKEQ